jgi:membrane-associated protease RseP (regulator of RpoE activity)
MTMRLLPMAALAAIVTAPLMAAPAWSESEDPTTEQRLEEASRRLEEAAREVARLSGEVHGPGAMERFELRVAGRPRAMIGVMLGDSDQAGDGVRVEGVSPGGPAAEAGIRAGDVIVAIDGKSIGTGRELVRAMQEVEPGQKVALDVRRDDRPLRIEVEARATAPGPEGPAMGGLFVPGWTGMSPDREEEHWLLGGWGDAELVTMSAGLGRYFGTDQGVLVLRAPAGVDQLQDGDVIQAIGGREPQSGPHAMRILRSYQPGETVELRILRDRKARTVKLSVPQPVGHGRIQRRLMPVPMPPPPPAPPVPPGADRT